ncbi:hypothetical protein DINM_002415 [Dirofilaria immitis]|nr:hypothetical protein [Dirofilaria immitis]
MGLCTFTDNEVAQLAAEAMDGYLMFEKRLECKVVKNEDFPACLRRGPRIIPSPLTNVTRRRHAMKLNKTQSGWCEEAAKKRLLKNIKIRRNKFAGFGYQLPSIIGLSEKEVAPVINETSPMKVEKIKSDNMINEEQSKLFKNLKKIHVKKKAITDMVSILMSSLSNFPALQLPSVLSYYHRIRISDDFYPLNLMRSTVRQGFDVAPNSFSLYHIVY